MSTPNGEGQALNATVSTTPPDGEARQALLDLAATMPEGQARDRTLAMADTLTTPAEMFTILADEAEAAAEAIKDKITGMEETRKSQVQAAKEYRRQAREAS